VVDLERICDSALKKLEVEKFEVEVEK